jgi:hypothetical protein
MRIEQNDALAKQLVDARLGVCLAEPFVGLVVMDGEYPRGAIIINNYEPGSSADITAIGRLSPTVLRELARYLFGTLKCRRVQAVTKASNVKARRALERLGFRREGVMREKWADSHGLLYGLLPAELKARF